MQKEKYEKFREKIYEFCDDNTGKRILFSGFAYVWNPLEEEITSRDLAGLTSEIINDLIREGVLREVPNEKRFESIYGMYEVLPH